MDYGDTKQTFPLNELGSTMKTVKKYRRGSVDSSFRHYRFKIKVNSPKEELEEFMRFTHQIQELRRKNMLITDRSDATTTPSFIVEYPKNDVDGSWFVIKNYCTIDMVKAP